MAVRPKPPRKTAPQKTTAAPPAVKKSGGRSAAIKTGGARPPKQEVGSGAPAVPNGGAKFRVRVRMYRQGLGDCFLITFPREKREPVHILIDCGALGRKAEDMIPIVEHIHATV